MNTIALAAHPASTLLAANVLNRRFSKSEAGRLEIRTRALPLSRSSRNLLLIIDSSRSAAEWLGVVQGCDQAAFQALYDAGLVVDGDPNGTGSQETSPPPDMAVAPTVASGAVAPQHTSVAQALEHCSYSALYNRITAEARPRLGLIKAYKMVMEVEQCSGAPEIRALALRFIKLERELHGDAAAKTLTQLLLAPE